MHLKDHVCGGLRGGRDIGMLDGLKDILTANQIRRQSLESSFKPQVTLDVSLALKLERGRIKIDVL
jgi:hypothetical protein